MRCVRAGSMYGVAAHKSEEESKQRMSFPVNENVLFFAKESRQHVTVRPSPNLPAILPAKYRNFPRKEIASKFRAKYRNLQRIRVCFGNYILISLASLGQRRAEIARAGCQGYINLKSCYKIRNTDTISSFAFLIRVTIHF